MDTLKADRAELGVRCCWKTACAARLETEISVNAQAHLDEPARMSG